MTAGRVVIQLIRNPKSAFRNSFGGVEKDGSRARSPRPEVVLAGRKHFLLPPRPAQVLHAAGARVRRHRSVSRRPAANLSAQPPRLRPRHTRHAPRTFHEGARAATREASSRRRAFDERGRVSPTPAPS